MRTSGTQATIRLVRLLEMTGRHYKTLSLTMKIQAQIMKGGVHRTDKRKLFLSPPGLNLFFSRDGIPHVTVSLEIHQPGHAVSLRKSRQPFFFMLSDAAFEVVGDPYVEDAGRACQNIDVVDHSVIPSASEESWLSSNPAESHETGPKPRRPPHHSERIETASSLQPSAPHSVIPSASEESCLGLNPAETNETRRKTPQALLSFRAKRDRFLSARFLRGESTFCFR